MKGFKIDPKAIIGKGTQGTVYRGTCVYKDGHEQEVAVKFVRMSFINESNLQNTLRQELSVTFCHDLNHKNIAKGIDVLHTENFICQVFELCEG